jgi:hypothetical protein
MSYNQKPPVHPLANQPMKRWVNRKTVFADPKAIRALCLAGFDSCNPNTKTREME